MFYQRTGVCLNGDVSCGKLVVMAGELLQHGLTFQMNLAEKQSLDSLYWAFCIIIVKIRLHIAT
jgi:hypothetical protein